MFSIFLIFLLYSVLLHFAPAPCSLNILENEFSASCFHNFLPLKEKLFSALCFIFLLFYFIHSTPQMFCELLLKLEILTEIIHSKTFPAGFLNMSFLGIIIGLTFSSAPVTFQIYIFRTFTCLMIIHSAKRLKQNKVELKNDWKSRCMIQAIWHRRAHWWSNIRSYKTLIKQRIASSNNALFYGFISDEGWGAGGMIHKMEKVPYDKLFAGWNIYSLLK